MYIRPMFLYNLETKMPRKKSIPVELPWPALANHTYVIGRPRHKPPLAKDGTVHNGASLR